MIGGHFEQHLVQPLRHLVHDDDTDADGRANGRAKNRQGDLVAAQMAAFKAAQQGPPTDPEQEPGVVPAARWPYIRGNRRRWPRHRESATNAIDNFHNVLGRNVDGSNRNVIIAKASPHATRNTPEVGADPTQTASGGPAAPSRHNPSAVQP
jgi:hypothetical protein